MTTRKPATKPPVHLRVREDNEIGSSVKYVSICGVKSHRRLEISKNRSAVTCALCLVLAPRGRDAPTKKAGIR